MKKNTLYLIIAIFILLPSVSSIEITGEAITGQISQQDFNLTIKIGGPPPELKIISPKSGTLISDRIMFEYQAKNYDEILLSIDNAQNISITGQIAFRLTEGFHTVTLYALNEYSSVSETINLTINKTLFHIFYDKYKSSSNTTNLESITFESMQNLEGLTLENEGVGKIIFNGIISLPKDFDQTDGVLNLDAYTEISHNKIHIDTIALPNFNTKATLLLNDLMFRKPIILKDGIECSALDCRQISYENGNLKFEVSGFSTYSAKEGYVEPTSSGGSGGGGSSKSKKGDFMIDENEIKTEAHPGENFKKSIIIKNLENNRIIINSQIVNIENIVSIPKQIILEPNEIKEIEIEFILRENLQAEMYLGEIILTSNTDRKEVWIVLEVESKTGLFDAHIKIINKEIHAGDIVIAKTDLYNLAGTKKIDAEIEYSIKNPKGETITKKRKTVAVETKVESVEELILPKYLPPGRYIAYMKVSYEEKVAIASEEFTVTTKIREYLVFIGYFLVIISIIILLSQLIIFVSKKKKRKKNKRSHK